MLDFLKPSRPSLLATPEDISTARARVTFLVNEAVEKKSLNSTNYVIVGQRSVYKDKPNAYCHIGIQDPEVDKPVCVATEIAIRRRVARYPDESRGLIETFVNFLRTDELWSPYLVDVGEDFITIDASAPQNVLHSLMMASRCVWEASLEAFELFNDALSRGVPSRVAFIYAFHSSVSSRDYTKPNPTSRTQNLPSSKVLPRSNHRPWGLLSLSGIRKYLEGSFKATKPYSEHHSTRNVQDMFEAVRTEYSSSGDYLISDLFKDERFTTALANFRQTKEKEVGIAIPNPFSKSATVTPLRGGEVSISEYRSVVLDHLVTIFVSKEGIRNVA